MDLQRLSGAQVCLLDEDGDLIENVQRMQKFFNLKEASEYLLISTIYIVRVEMNAGILGGKTDQKVTGWLGY